MDGWDCLHIQLSLFSSSFIMQTQLCPSGSLGLLLLFGSPLKLFSRFPFWVASVLCAGICFQVVSSPIKAFPQSFLFCHMSQVVFTCVQGLRASGPQGHYFFNVSISSGRTSLPPYSTSKVWNRSSFCVFWTLAF